MVDLIAGGRGGGEKVAVVAGATGLVGKELIKSLLCSPSDWTLIYGIARRPPDNADENSHSCKYQFVQCDLLDPEQTTEKLGSLAGQVTHLFWATWASQFPLDMPDCCEQNSAMLMHALNALLTPGSPALCHVCLQTGTKHYVSLKAPGLTGPYLEEEILGKHNHDHGMYNFYYHIERLVMEHAGRGHINSWSVHRPGLLFGASNRSYFNIMGSLCVYGSLCRHLGMPFRFYGTKFCWEEHYIDMSDARVVASQQIWWALSSHDPCGASAEAFNAVDTAPFIWKQVWPALAAKFGIQQESEEKNSWLSEETCYTYAEMMSNKERAWGEIISANALRKTRIEELANWGFLDSLFRFSGKLVAAPGKAERRGFVPLKTYTDANTEAVLYWVDRIREMRLIP
jgi:nucleoside-diphosphate-sugar epimerase